MGVSSTKMETLTKIRVQQLSSKTRGDRVKTKGIDGFNIRKSHYQSDFYAVLVFAFSHAKCDSCDSFLMTGQT